MGETPQSDGPIDPPQSQDSNSETAAASNPEPAALISEEETAALLERSAPGGVRTYDMLARRINRSQLPGLEHIAQTFALRAGATLSTFLSRDAALKFDVLEQVKSQDYFIALPQPATLAVLRVKPLPGEAIFNFDSKLLMSLLDGFFGGSGNPGGDNGAVSSLAAQRFLSVIVRTLAADFMAAWQPLSPVELEWIRQESNPRLIAAASGQEALTIVRFVVEFGEISGNFDWLLPDPMLAPVRELLAAAPGAAVIKAPVSWSAQIGTRLQTAMVETRAVLGHANLNLGELMRLAPGDVIPIEAPDLVMLLAENVPLYRGRFGVSQGRNALKILPGVPV